MFFIEFFEMLIGVFSLRCAQVAKTTQAPSAFVWSVENGFARPVLRPTRGSKLLRTTRFAQKRMLTLPLVRWLTLTVKE